MLGRPQIKLKAAQCLHTTIMSKPQHQPWFNFFDEKSPHKESYKKHDSPVESCGSKLCKACEGAHTSKDTISNHLIEMLVLVNIPHFSRLSNAVVVTIKLGLG
jgi:hypothetical protein